MTELLARQRSARPGAFGQLLRRYRTTAGMTQEELAERAELSPRGLAYLEAGTRSPHRATIRRLAEALRLDGEGRVALEAAARQPAPERAEMPHALTAPLTPIFGRERDEAVALDLLRRSEVRLLTLTGTGGVGKTRLALLVAERLGPELADGVAAVALDTVRDPELVRTPSEAAETAADRPAGPAPTTATS
jgi:transcriptional regulator with XRE-family HTH domain